MNPVAPVRKTSSLDTAPSGVWNGSADDIQRGAQGLTRRLHRLEDGGRLVPAVRHAIGAPLVASAPVRFPVRRLDQLAIGRHIPVGEEVAGALPAEHGKAGDSPGRAGEIDLPLEKVEEEGRVIEPPLLAPSAGKGIAKDLPCSIYRQKVLLVGRLLVGVARRNLHRVDLEFVVEEVQDIADALSAVLGEEGRVGGDAEPALLGFANRLDRLVEYTAAAEIGRA